MTYIVDLKRKAELVAKLAGVRIPSAFNADHDGMGTGGDTLLRRLAGEAGINSPGAFAVAHARLDIGISEHPPGSNSGPRINKALRYCGLTPGQPWCAAIVSLWLAEVGWKEFKSASTRAWEAWGHAHGRDLAKDRGQSGDVVTFQFETESPGGEHTGLVIKYIGGTYTTIEGNTSPTDGGSQSNGGMVCVRQRPIGLVNHIIRVF